jgi:hypothetical protein
MVECSFLACLPTSKIVQALSKDAIAIVRLPLPIALKFKYLTIIIQNVSTTAQHHPQNLQASRFFTIP